MMPDLPSVARALILMLAFAWPFGAILYVPFLDVTLLPLAGAAVVILAIIDAVKNRERRPPFELVWPVFAAIVLVWFDPEIESKVQYTIGLALFLAIAQFAQGRRFVNQCLQASAAAGAVVAGLALVNVWLPSAISSLHRMPMLRVFHTSTPDLLIGPMITSPEALLEGLITLIVCCVAALAGLRYESRKVQYLTVFTTVPIVLFVPVVLLWILRLGLPTFGVPHPVHVIFMALLMWLTSRASAKQVVYYRELGIRRRVPTILAGVAAVGLVLTSPVAVFPAFLLVLGILTGGVQAAGPLETRTLPLSICAVPVFALLGINLFQVNPANQDDPRNYEAHIRKDILDNRLEDAWMRVSAIRFQVHSEPRACLWTARLALEFDRPYQAAHEFRYAVDTEGSWRALLPPPSETEIDDFLVRMRDYCSNLPDSNNQYAYEKSLFAAGKNSAALTLLESRAVQDPAVKPPVGRDLLLDTVRAALECEGDVLDQPALSTGALWGLLKAWGTEVRTGVIPELQQPAAVIVRFGTIGIECDILNNPNFQSGGISAVGYIVILSTEWPFGRTDTGAPAGPPAFAWDFTNATSTRPEAKLVVRGTEKDTQTNHFSIQEGADFGVTMYPDILPPFPDKPAILILLP